MNKNYGIVAPTGVRSEAELKRLQAMLRPRAATGVWSREDQSAYDAYLKKEAADPLSYRVYGYEPPAMVSNRARVESMQDILGVKVDGLWGPQTQAAYDARRQEEAALRTQQARGERGLVPLQGGVDDGYVSAVPDSPMIPNRVYAERDNAAALARQYRGTLGSTTLQGGIDDNYVSAVPDGPMTPNRVKAGDTPTLVEKVYQGLLGVAQQKSGEAGRMAMNEGRTEREENSFSTSEMRFETEAQAKAFYQPFIEEAWGKYLASVKFLGRKSRQKWQVDSNSASLYKEYTELKQSLEQAIQDIRKTQYPFFDPNTEGLPTNMANLYKWAIPLSEEAWYGDETPNHSMGQAFIGVSDALLPNTDWDFDNLLKLENTAYKTGVAAIHYFDNKKVFDSYPIMTPDGQPRGKREPMPNPFSYDGFVVRQNDFDATRDLKTHYGTGTIRDNGCGTIAAYNVLKVLEESDHPSFSRVVFEMEPGSLVWGQLGTNPAYVIDYFRKKGYSVAVNYTKESVEQAAETADANIWVNIYAGNNGKPGAHYVAVQPIGNDQFRFFNQNASNDDIKIGPIEKLYEPFDVIRMMISISKP